jgi:hypothetical protein
VGTWDEFITAALLDPAEPADMTALRKALDSGAQLMHVSLDWPNRGEPPHYIVVLDRPPAPLLVNLQVRHSDSFMKWSLGAQARLLTPDQEALRTLYLLQESFQRLEQEWGISQFDSVLIEYLRSVGPRRVLALLSGYDQPLLPASALKDSALSLLQDVLSRRARDLKRLGYSAPEVAEILDKALAHYTDARYGLSLRQSLLSR